MRTVPGPTDHVVVVGAGLSGLSAAVQLAGRGRRVTVVERYGFPGGRMGQADVRGYRIDTGPTVLTMPDIIEEAFAAETARLVEGWERMAQGLPPGFDHAKFSYVARGQYAPQLRRWRERFPDDQLLVLDYRDLECDASGVMARVFHFLELEPYAVDTSVRHHTGDYAPAPPALRPASASTATSPP